METLKFFAWLWAMSLFLGWTATNVGLLWVVAAPALLLAAFLTVAYTLICAGELLRKIFRVK